MTNIEEIIYMGFHLMPQPLTLDDLEFQYFLEIKGSQIVFLLQKGY